MTPKILLWDLETTNLSANFGYLLCFGYKYLGEPKEKTKVKSITDYKTFKTDCTNDRELVKEAYDILASADCWGTWYGKRFDWPWFNSRLLYHGFKPLPPIPHIDGWQIARYRMHLNSNRLGSVSAFVGCEEKTPLTGPHWVKAAAGHKASIRYVVEHCRQDVVVLEQVIERIRPFASGLPNMALIVRDPDACPVCATHGKMQKRGTQIASTSLWQRFQCTACGAWSRAPLKKADAGAFSVRVRN